MVAAFNRRTRHCRAQSIIETVVGIIFLIPIVLFMFDVAVLLICNTANDNIAKQCARAAASASPDTSAWTQATWDAQKAANYPAHRNAARNAADRVMNNFARGKTGAGNGFMNSPNIVRMLYYNGTTVGGFTNNGPALTGEVGAGGSVNPGRGNVAIVTRINCQLPVPIPGNTNRTFYAKAVEPIVSIPPE